MNIKHITVVLLILVSTIAAHQFDTNFRINNVERLRNQIQRVERSHSTGSVSHITLKTPFAHNGADFDSHVEQFFREYSIFGVRAYRNQLKLAGKQRDMHFADRYTAYFEQHHEGMKVFGSGIRLHFDGDNQISSADGIFVNDLETVDTTFTIEEDQAREIALNHFAKSNAVIEAIEPMIYRTNLFANRQGENIATWSCIVSDNQIRRERIFVQAQTGQVIDSIPLVHSIHREIWRGAYLVGEPFWVEGDAFPTNSSTANLNLNVSLDIYNAFKNAFNYTSYDNNDTKMITVFDLVDDPENPICPNAFWNGTLYAACPGITAFDVAAHEWGHAYIQYSADLVYRDQSGAINEAFADIIGESIQLFFATDYPVRNNSNCTPVSKRWIIGEDLGFPALNNNGVRDMYNPHCFQDPRSVNDIQYVQCGSADQGGVHTNSGIVNQLYAFSVDGGQLNGVTVDGVGLLKGFHIYMRTLLTKLTPSSNFKDLAVALQASCNDLIGKNLTSPVTGNVTSETITEDDCTSISNAINATALTSPFCTLNETIPRAPDVFFAFPPIGEVGNITTTAYFLAHTGFARDTASNGTCLIVDEQFNQVRVNAEILNFELFYVFACPIESNSTKNYTVGEKLFITVSGNGMNFSTYGLNFTFVRQIDLKSIRPTTGYVGGGTVVTVTGDNFVEYTGCQPFETRDVNGNVYDCLTCIFGNTTIEQPVAATYINSTTITCKAPPFTSLLYPNETVSVWVSENAQTFTTNPNATFTYTFAVGSPSITPTTVSLSPTRSPTTITLSITPTRTPVFISASRTPVFISASMSIGPTFGGPVPFSVSRSPTRFVSRSPTRSPSQNSATSLSTFFAIVFASFAVLMTAFFF